MNDIGPPRKANGSKIPARVQFIERFAQLDFACGSAIEHYAKLDRCTRFMHYSSNYIVGYLVPQFGGLEKALQELWPRENIRRPSFKHTARRVSLMLGAFPNASPHSPELYTSTLLAYITAERPSAMALESACMQMEQTQKFLPAISEMLAALREHETKWMRGLDLDRAAYDGTVQKMRDMALETIKKKVADTARRLEERGHGELAAQVRAEKISPSKALHEAGIEREW